MAPVYIVWMRENAKEKAQGGKRRVEEIVEWEE